MNFISSSKDVATATAQLMANLAGCSGEEGHAAIWSACFPGTFLALTAAYPTGETEGVL